MIAGWRRYGRERDSANSQARDQAGYGWQETLVVLRGS